MIISSLLPNPKGDDRAGEWLKIENSDSVLKNLFGWELRTTRGKLYKFNNLSLTAGESLVLTYKDLKFNLRNAGDEISLFGPAGNLVDVFKYAGPVVEGLVLERNLQPAELFENWPQTFGKIQPVTSGADWSWLLALAMLALAATYIMSYYSKKWGK